MRQTYVHQYDFKHQKNNDSTGPCRIQPRDNLTIVPDQIMVNVIDVGRKYVYVASDKRIDLLSQPLHVTDSCNNILKMRVVGNEMNTWYTLQAVDKNATGKRFSATIRNQTEFDPVIETFAEDNVTIDGNLDEWWTKEDWKEKMTDHPELTEFQVILARMYAREANHQQDKDSRDFHIVAAMTAIDS